MFLPNSLDKYMEKEKMLEFLAKSIQVNSVNPPGNEETLALYLAEQMKSLGLEVRVEPLIEKHANVIGILKGRGEKPGPR